MKRTIKDPRSGHERSIELGDGPAALLEQLDGGAPVDADPAALRVLQVLRLADANGITVAGRAFLAGAEEAPRTVDTPIEPAKAKPKPKPPAKAKPTRTATGRPVRLSAAQRILLEKAADGPVEGATKSTADALIRRGFARRSGGRVMITDAGRGWLATFK